MEAPAWGVGDLANYPIPPIICAGWMAGLFPCRPWSAPLRPIALNSEPAICLSSARSAGLIIRTPSRRSAASSPRRR